MEKIPTEWSPNDYDNFPQCIFNKYLGRMEETKERRKNKKKSVTQSLRTWAQK